MRDDPWRSKSRVPCDLVLGQVDCLTVMAGPCREESLHCLDVADVVKVGVPIQGQGYTSLPL
jgi:hypothetical protein